MTFGAVSSDHWAGAARTTLDAKATFSSEARAAGLLWVDLEPPRPAVRGRLCLYIEGAIERALDARGAPPPRAFAAAREEVIADQIRRALVSGTSGIALWFASLEAIAGSELAFDTGDSMTLRWWLEAAGAHPVRIAFDESNGKLAVYSTPRSLASLLAEASSDADTSSDDDASDADARVYDASDVHADASDADASVDDVSDVDEDASDADARIDDAIDANARIDDASDVVHFGSKSEELTSDERVVTHVANAPMTALADEERVAPEVYLAETVVPGGVAARPETRPPSVPDLVVDAKPTAATEAAPGQAMAESARAMAQDIADDSDTGWLRHALIELSTPEPSAAKRVESTAISRIEPLAIRVLEAPRRATTPAQVADTVCVASDQLVHDDTETDASMPAESAAATSAVEPESPSEAAPEVSVPEAPHLELALVEGPGAAEPNTVDVEAETKRKLEACWRELASATGPKPLTVVERLFSTAYMPLRAALDRGADMPALRETADDWSQSFEKSYKDGFDALRVRNKRPAMVVDVPDIALRVARLHGARSTQLLLVDSMRHDLGDLVNERIRAIVGQRAACAERFLLWAALPTNTATQVELIGRGAAGLREPIGTTSEELIVGRGRKAQMIRRLKTGHRELLKLDIVAARLTEPQGGDPNRFETIADEVAQRIAAHFEGLQPRTLVMIFGDHGFTVERHADGRTSLSEGGASPEEVMVPAFAWLVGAVH